MERPRPGGPSARTSSVLALALLAAFVPASSLAHDDDLGLGVVGAVSVDGTWRLVSPPLAGGAEQYKTIGGGRFVWYIVADGRLAAAAGGRMSFRDGDYREEIEFAATAAHHWMVGGRGRFTARLRGDGWHHRGTVTSADGETNATVDERWVRVRGTDGARGGGPTVR